MDISFLRPGRRVVPDLAIDFGTANTLVVVRDALSETPPELSRDIHDNGIMPTGGCATIGVIEQAVREGTGLTTRVADDALLCVANGLFEAG